MNERELSVIEKARRAMDEDKSIPGTACRYCTDGCPMSIPIPEVFKVKNDVIRYQPWDGGNDAYAIATQGKGKASDCIACGQCEAACPQQLEIIELLRDCVSMD